MQQELFPGIDTLVLKHADWLRGKRIGLVAHPASVNAEGRHTAEVLLDVEGAELKRLFGAEHGFFGRAMAGEHVQDERHPELDLPVHSLYGESVYPPLEWFEDLDVVVFDLQDIAVRCYTYLATLRIMMESLAKAGKTLIVCDRPVPFPNTVDGPMREKNNLHFVAPAKVPLVYGMTPGEAAGWLKKARKIDVDLRVAKLQHYHREMRRGDHWFPWVPPSPAIRTWETVWTYPMLVFTEALPVFTCDRHGDRAFRCLHSVSDKITECILSETFFGLQVAEESGVVAFSVVEPEQFEPVKTSVRILEIIHQVMGTRLWETEKARPDFFDKLMGGPGVRGHLVSGRSVLDLSDQWELDRADFMISRKEVLLYTSV